MTNADRIRAAGDEELVQFLIDRIDTIGKGGGPQIWIGNFNGTAGTEAEARKLELEWLCSKA